MDSRPERFAQVAKNRVALRTRARKKSVCTTAIYAHKLVYLKYVCILAYRFMHSEGGA